MSQALYTAASGLLAHQRKLDIVANNLANLNTAGYKAQRILFSDQAYATLASASSGGGVSVGGTNPRQIGFGVNVAQISRNQTQGMIDSTGSALDFAIDGYGYFVVNDGLEKFTRAGSFTLDDQGYLTDPGTGAYVQRFGTVGEGLTGGPVFQIPGNKNIHIPLGAGIAGRPTTKTIITGNLPSSFALPRSQVLTSASPFKTGGAPATATTLLNDLSANNADYTTGDNLIITGSDADGTPISSTLSVDATTTLGDVVDHYNSLLSGATATLGTGGSISIKAHDVGPSKLSLKLTDNGANTGASDFSGRANQATTIGKNGDTTETTVEVFDVRGASHSVQAVFEKKENNIWDATFNLVDGSGTTIDGVVRQIEFNERGEFQVVSGTGDGDSDISLNFNSTTDPQTVDIDLAGMTHMASNFSATYFQDGYPPGNIVSVTANADGVLEGVVSNGERIVLAQLGIANFINIDGLNAVGQNYFTSSSSSGAPQIGAGAAGGTGKIRSRQLESSNVDVALEFTQLIVAQRGFSANARTITVASEVLDELNNLVR